MRYFSFIRCLLLARSLARSLYVYVICMKMIRTSDPFTYSWQGKRRKTNRNNNRFCVVCCMFQLKPLFVITCVYMHVTRLAQSLSTLLLLLSLTMMIVFFLFSLCSIDVCILRILNKSYVVTVLRALRAAQTTRFRTPAAVAPASAAFD